MQMQRRPRRPVAGADGRREWDVVVSHALISPNGGGGGGS